MIVIRPFERSEADYTAAVRIEEACWPNYATTVEDWKHGDATRDPQYLYRRLLVENDGEIVAVGTYGDAFWAHQPGKYYVGIQVHPDYRRRRIASYLYRHMVERLEPHGPTRLVSDTREDQSDGIDFLEHRGFTRVLRTPESELDLDRFDPTSLVGYANRVADQGIEIRSLAELMEAVPDWEVRYYDAHWEALRDIPSTDPITRPTFETFITRATGSPKFIPEAIMIALDGEEWVGVSQLWKDLVDPERLFTGLTGVRRSHRRRGIAMAMKLRALEVARALGARRVETENEENNPMYEINLRLGFAPRPAWLQYEKRLNDDGEVADAPD